MAPRADLRHSLSPVSPIGSRRRGCRFHHVHLIYHDQNAPLSPSICERRLSGRKFVTFDDHSTLDAANSDPVSFIRALDRAVVDEVQRSRLLLAIKSVDEDQAIEKCG
jgi:hypothetical protein